MADKLIRTFRFRLKPTRAQHNALREALEWSRQIYNAALEERIHRCGDCGHEADRDVAAAQVILHRAVHGPAGAKVGHEATLCPRKAVA